MGSMSLWHWIIVIAVVLLLFGRGKISELMGDVAQGIKAFKKGMSEDEAAKAEPPKTDPPPVEQPPIGPPAGAPAPAPQLRTPNTPDAAQAERQVRDAINRATGLLNTIDYRVLTNERRAQYDNAKLMLKQAEDAVKTANFDFAKNLAEKAERIAKELQG